MHVNLAAWSVNTTSTGQVELTLRELKDGARRRGHRQLIADRRGG